MGTAEMEKLYDHIFHKTVEAPLSEEIELTLEHLKYFQSY